MDAPLKVEIEEGIALLTMNRPESRNPLDPEMQDALLDTLSSLDAGQQVRVAILTGAGTAFCAGGNVRRMGEAASGPKERTPAQARGYYRWGIQRIPRLLERDILWNAHEGFDLGIQAADPGEIGARKLLGGDLAARQQFVGLLEAKLVDFHAYCSM